MVKSERGGDNMAQIGDTLRVGEAAKATGRYKHSACDNTIILNKDNVAPPCSLPACPNKGAHWILVNFLT